VTNDEMQAYERIRDKLVAERDALRAANARQAEVIAAWLAAVPRCHCGAPSTCDDWEGYLFCDAHRPKVDDEPSDRWWATLVRAALSTPKDPSGKE
jgi:hypothetical protein